uniref:Uncharacterized protein n=1 Tax=Anguilla anguilla TaxID=7936 RepID=A0A0E9R327_ANGAN
MSWCIHALKATHGHLSPINDCTLASRFPCYKVVLSIFPVHEN